MPKRNRSQEARDLAELEELVSDYSSDSPWSFIARILRAHARRLANLELRRDRKQERRPRRK